MIEFLDIHKQKTIVILDLDETVMRALTRVASEGYYHHCIDQLVNQGWEEKAATREVNREYNAFQEASFKAALADDRFHIGNTIASLKAKGVDVIALTARESIIMDVTLRQLGGLSVCFSEDVLEDIEIQHDDYHLKAKQGVICASNLNKGRCLSVIEANTKLNLADYDEVIFIDDRQPNCDDVANYLNTTGVSYKTHHYPFVSEVFKFDDVALKIAQFQDQYFQIHHRIPSDNEALALLNTVPELQGI